MPQNWLRLQCKTWKLEQSASGVRCPKLIDQRRLSCGIIIYKKQITFIQLSLLWLLRFLITCVSAKLSSRGSYLTWVDNVICQGVSDAFFSWCCFLAASKSIIIKSHFGRTHKSHKPVSLSFQKIHTAVAIDANLFR